VSNRYEVVWIPRPVDTAKVSLGYDVHGVIDRGVLGDAALESAMALSFADQLNAKPAIPEESKFLPMGGSSTSTYLGHDAVEVNEAEGDSHEAADLSNAVSLAVDEAQSSNGVIG
jgi:hypothetical protein